jgi:Flp pilus assembly protein TadG
VEFALVMPIMLVMLVGVLDLARVYTTMMSVESAAREAADFGTTLGAARWDPAVKDSTVDRMRERACVAASDLPDYSDPSDNNPATGCDNPSFTYCITTAVGAPGASCDPYDPMADCQNPARPSPCAVTVTLSYNFQLLAPLNFEFMGVTYGIPSTLPFSRDSTFAMTDIDLAPGAP